MNADNYAINQLKTFAHMMGSQEVSEFFHLIYEKKYLHVIQNNSEYYSEILNSNLIDHLLETGLIPCAALSVLKDGNEIHSDNWSAETNLRRRLSEVADINKLYGLLSTGHSLVINGAENIIPEVGRYVERLENEMKLRVQANIYITPPGNSAFGLHHDDHDVFVLQIQGRKLWSIYNPVIKLPSDIFPRGNYSKNDIGDADLQLVLEQGNMLYLPRGYVHSARCTDELSIHLTIGLHPVCGFSLVKSLASDAELNELFRSSIPFEFDQGATIDLYTKEFKANLIEMIDSIDSNQLMRFRNESFLNKALMLHSGRLFDSARVNSISLDTIIHRRENRTLKITKTNETIILNFTGGELVFPVFLESSIKSIVSSHSVCVKDIRGLISEAGKIELSKTFVVNGLYTLA